MSGIVQCVATIEYNNTIYTTVFNPETVTDTANYDKFTCLVRKSLITIMNFHYFLQCVSKRLYINFEGKNSSFRFMPQFCLTLKAISKVGETLYISDAKGSCVKGQTSTVKTSTGSGTLVLSTYSKSHELKKILTLSFSIWTNLCFLKFIIFFIYFFFQVDVVSTCIYVSKS